MKISRGQAVSTSLAAVVIVVIIVAATAAVYITMQSAKTETTTVTSTTTSVSSSTVTRTATSISTETPVSTSTATTTATSVYTTTATSVYTTTATSVYTTTSTVSATPSRAIPTQTLVVASIDSQWSFQPVGNDVQLEWGAAAPWYPQVYEQLLEYDPAQLKNGQYVPIPWLAQNLTVSSDGLTVVIYLRQGIRFHTGNMMTSTDVKYSYDRYLFFTDFPSSSFNSPGAGLSHRDAFSSIANVSRAGPYTIVLHLARPDPLIPDELANQGLSILDSAAVESHAVTTSNSSDHGSKWLDREGGDAGTGPFALASITLQSRVELNRFAAYWGDPYDVDIPLQRIIYLPYADASAAKLAMEHGSVNALLNVTDYETASLSIQPGFSVIRAPAAAWINIYMHPVGPLADWRVRQAMKMTIDYEGIISSLSLGLDYASQSNFAIGTEGWNNETAGYFARQAPNITGAKALLAEAGYPNGFRVRLYTRFSTQYGIILFELADILHNDWNRIGINLGITICNPRQFYALAQNKTLPGIWTMSSSLFLWSAQTNLETILGSGNALLIGWNATSEKGPGINFTMLYNLWHQSQHELNVTKRVAIEQQVDRYLVLYGATVPVIEIADKIVYVSAISGIVWNTVTQGFATAPLSSP